jgi:hypothetical protein
MTAQPDACGDSSHRDARSCMSVDRSIIVARRFGAIARIASEVEVRA